VTVAGAVALTGEAGATPASGSKEKRQRVTIHLNRYTQIGQSGLRAQKLEVFTGDKGLARFLRKSAELRRVKQALDKRLAKVKLATLFDGRKLYQLERSLGAIVAGQYQKRTGRGAGSPDVMLSVTRHYGRMRLGGAMIRPHFPRRPTP